LELPELSPGALQLWEWFLELNTGERLPWAEIAAWAMLTHQRLTPDIAHALRRLSLIQQAILNKPE
jgi:hypothetical protein